MLDKSNISDIECCTGIRRQKSKLLKILLMKGKLACKELFRVVEVDLKKKELVQQMAKKSADMKTRGSSDI